MSQTMTSQDAAEGTVVAAVDGARLPRRRSWPLALVGALAMVVSAVAFGLFALDGEERVPVLVAARDIAAGEVLSLADTAEVMMVVDPRLDVIEADEADSAVGGVLAVPVVAGTMLTEPMLSGQSWPDQGRAVTTLRFASGHYPAAVQPGWTAAVYLPVDTAADGDETGTGGATSSVWSFEAVVLSVAVSGEDALIDLELDEADAALLASVALEGAVMAALAPDGGS